MITLKTIKSGDPIAKDIDILMYDNGFYYIGRHDDESIWIGTECGEGMQISNDKFYQLISDFYAKEF